MPSIGYGSNKKTRHCLPDGFKKFLVNNVVCGSNILYLSGVAMSPRCPCRCWCWRPKDTGNS
jgi:hypothetical protein